MTWRSRVPEVLDALVATWRASPPLADVVQDGPTPLATSDVEVVSVGHDGGDEGTSTEGTVAFEGLTVEPNREQFTVVCLVAVLNGASDMAAARVRAFELLSAAADTLTDNHTLGGVVMRAGLRDVSLNQLQTEAGALAQILFTVAVDAYTAT